VKRITDLPIYVKLLALILLSSGASLLVAGIIIVFYDTVNHTEQSIADLKTQAEIVGANSAAALIFNDPKTASQYLSALSAKRTIVAAAIYDADGRLFAQYVRSGTRPAFPEREKPGSRIESGDAILFDNITQGGEKVGTVYLRAHLGRTERIIRYASIVLLVMLLGLGIGVLVSSRLQANISTPIRNITNVARNMVLNQDDPLHPYRERAVKYGADEIGVLADAFNQMLIYMEKRDAALLEANRSLIAEVRERKRAQELLDQKIRDLAQSNAELEQFAYVSSHDLQEPLRMVASYAQLLERRYRSQFDADGLEFLGYIVDGAKRMRQLIDDLLTFSRIGTQAQEIHAVSSDDALNVALANLSLAIKELAQLFQNLIANAIVYRRTGEPPQVQIRAERKDSQWQFAVKDNGIGIAPEHRERIFVIFQRLHGRGEYPGTGIGLAICKKIAERHGGRIWVDSEVGKGSTFYFLLPAVS
jgi:signal transduction histidine kinase